MIYFSSDLHLNHNKSFIYERRGFASVGDMNYTILKNFNHIVNDNDDLYLLGDIFLGDLDSGIKLFNQLPGKIHLIYGNHDTINRIEAMSKCHNVVEVCGYANILKYDNYKLYLSHYPTLTANYDIDKPLNKRVLCLAGHTHSSNKFEDCGSYNVAIEAHNCCPVSIENIIQDFHNKENA